ncbi:sulfotransferase family protein [Humitalea rosea]|uniref:Sulfotransferase family protein n=1 Tax=Humitalea rosea TaxID=990373 RepID=A0A2W7K6D2_9PROT|nr:sulfotransferase [Humitalea rosea]PZW43070.1 sulfotransferase family protein [Humitalea rosea]
MQSPVLLIAGPARSGLTSLAAAFAAALGMPQRDATAELARVALVADAGQRQARRYAELGLPAPATISPALAQALLDDLLAGAAPGGGQLLRAAEWLPEAAILPALRVVLPHLPQARVVLLHRNGVDTIASRMRARPGMDFVQHCLSWAGAMEAAEALAAACPAQVTLLGLEEVLAHPDAALGRVAAFLGLGMPLRDRLRAELGRGALGRDGLDPAAAGPGLTEIAWSTPEKELFVALCGGAMQIGGYALGDAAARLRRAPLRLAEMTEAGMLRSEGLAASWPDRETLRLNCTGTGPAILVCAGIAPAGRMRLTGRLRGHAAGLALRLDVVGTLSRQMVMSRDFALSGSESADLDVTFSAVPEMIDLVVSVVPPHEAPMGADLCDIRLSLG